jgi:hypothetical protein
MMATALRIHTPAAARSEPPLDVVRFISAIVFPGALYQDGVTDAFDTGVLTLGVSKSIGVRSRHIRLG